MMGESLNSAHHIFYPDDCVVVTFDSIQSLVDQEIEYSPFPSDSINCNFESGDITCEKLNNYSILLTINEA